MISYLPVVERQESFIRMLMSPKHQINTWRNDAVDNADVSVHSIIRPHFMHRSISQNFHYLHRISDDLITGKNIIRK